MPNYTFDSKNPSGLQPVQSDLPTPTQKYSFEPATYPVVGSSFVASHTDETKYDTTPLAKKTDTQVSSSDFQPELDESKATNQGFGELAVKALANFVTKGVGMAISGVGTLGNVSKTATLFSGNNDLSQHAYAEDNFLEKLGTGISEAGPDIYQTQAAKEGFALSDPTWWAGTVVPGLSSVVGIMIPAYAVGKGTSMLGNAISKASLLNKLATTGKTAELVNGMTKGVGSFLGGEWGQTISSAISGRMIDSGQSAGQTYNELHNSFKSDGFDDATARRMAADGARSAYRMSYGNIVFDLFEWNTMLKGMGKTNLTRTAFNALDDKLETNLGTGLGANILETVGEKTAHSPFKDALLTGASEAADEVTMDYAQNLGKRKSEREAYGTELTPYLDRNSADSAFIGALGGLLSFGLFRYANRKAEAQQDVAYQEYVDNIVQRATGIKEHIARLTHLDKNDKTLMSDALYTQSAVDMASRSFAGGLHQIDISVLKALAAKKSSELTQDQIDEAVANDMSVTTPEAASKLLGIYQNTVTTLESNLSNKITKRTVSSEISDYYNNIDKSTDSVDIKQEKKAFVKEHFDTLVDNVITHRTISKLHKDSLTELDKSVEKLSIEDKANYDDYYKVFTDPNTEPGEAKYLAIANSNVITYDNSLDHLNTQKKSLQNKLDALTSHKADLSTNKALSDEDRVTSYEKAINEENEINNALKQVSDSISKLDTPELQDQRKSISEFTKLLTTIGLDLNSTIEEYTTKKNEIDILQQDGKLNESQVQVITDYYKHTESIAKLWKLKGAKVVSEDQSAYIKAAIAEKEKQSNLSTSELVNSIYNLRRSAIDTEYNNLKTSIEDNKLNESGLKTIKAKLNKYSDQRFKDLATIIDSHLSDITAANKARNAEKAARNAESKPTTSTTTSTSVTTPVTTDNSETDIRKLITSTSAVLESLNDPRLKGFNLITNKLNTTDLIQSYPTNLNFQSVIDSVTLENATELADKYVKLDENSVYTEMTNVLTELQQCLKKLEFKGKELFIPIGISNSDFNLLINKFNNAYITLAKQIGSNELLLDAPSQYNIALMAYKLTNNLKIVQDTPPLGENDSNVTTQSETQSEPTVDENNSSESQNEQESKPIPTDARGLVDSILNSVAIARETDFTNVIVRRAELSDEDAIVADIQDDVVSTLVTAIDSLYKLSYGDAPYKISYYGLLHAVSKAYDIDFAMANYDTLLSAFGFIGSMYMPSAANPDSESHSQASEIIERFQISDTLKVPSITELLNTSFKEKVKNILIDINNVYESKYAGSSDLYTYTRASNNIEVNKSRTTLRNESEVSWLNEMIDIKSGDEVTFEVADSTLMKDAERTSRLGDYINSDLFKPILVNRNGKMIGEIPDVQITDGGVNYVWVTIKDNKILHKYKSYIDTLLQPANSGSLDLILENQTFLKELWLSKEKDKVSKLKQNEDLYSLFTTFAKQNLKFNSSELETDYKLTNDQIHELLKPIWSGSNQQWFDDIVLDSQLLKANYSKFNIAKQEQYDTTVAIRSTITSTNVSLKGVVSNKSLPSLIFGNSSLVQEVLKPEISKSGKSEFKIAVIKPSDVSNTLCDATTGLPVQRNLISNYDSLDFGSQSSNVFMLVPRGDGTYTACRTSNSILGVTKGESSLNSVNATVLQNVAGLVTELARSTDKESANNTLWDLHHYIITNHGKSDSDIWFKALVGDEEKPNLLLFKSFDALGNHLYKQLRVSESKGTFTVNYSESELLNSKKTLIDRTEEGTILGKTTVAKNLTFQNYDEFSKYITSQCVGLMRNVPIETQDGNTKVAMPRSKPSTYRSNVTGENTGLSKNNILDFCMRTGAFNTKLGKISDGSGNVITNFNYGNNNSSLKPLSKGGLYFKATTEQPTPLISDVTFNASTTGELVNWTPFSQYVELLNDLDIPIVRRSAPDKVEPGKRPRAEFSRIGTSKSITIFDAMFTTISGLNRNPLAIAADIAHELFHDVIDSSKLGTLLDQQRELFEKASKEKTTEHVEILPELQPLVDFRQSLIDSLDTLSEQDKVDMTELINYTDPQSGKLDELITTAFFNTKFVKLLSSIHVDSEVSSSDTLLDRLISVLFNLVGITSDKYNASKLKELSTLVSNLLTNSRTDEIQSTFIEIKPEVQTENTISTETEKPAEIPKNKGITRKIGGTRRSEISDESIIFDSEYKPIC